MQGTVVIRMQQDLDFGLGTVLVGGRIIKDLTGYAWQSRRYKHNALVRKVYD
jgi:hypothetical protein